MPEADIYRFEASALPASLSLARMFVATVARVLGVDEEVVDDLKLAITELFSVVISGGTAQKLAINITASETVAVTVTPISREASDDDLDPTTVVLALFPTIRFDESAHSATIDLTPTTST